MSGAQACWLGWVLVSNVAVHQVVMVATWQVHLAALLSAKGHVRLSDAS